MPTLEDEMSSLFKKVRDMGSKNDSLNKEIRGLRESLQQAHQAVQVGDITKNKLIKDTQGMAVCIQQLNKDILNQKGIAEQEATRRKAIEVSMQILKEDAEVKIDLANVNAKKMEESYLILVKEHKTLERTNHTLIQEKTQLRRALEQAKTDLQTGVLAREDEIRKLQEQIKKEHTSSAARAQSNEQMINGLKAKLQQTASDLVEQRTSSQRTIDDLNTTIREQQSQIKALQENADDARSAARKVATYGKFFKQIQTLEGQLQADLQSSGAGVASAAADSSPRDYVASGRGEKKRYADSSDAASSNAGSFDKRACV
jgi:chromosome segregation ATPase